MKIGNLQITKYKNENFCIIHYKNHFIILAGNSKVLYLETKNYWLGWINKKLNNEDFVDYYKTANFKIFKNLFWNLYLGKFW